MLIAFRFGIMNIPGGDAGLQTGTLETVKTFAGRENDMAERDHGEIPMPLFNQVTGSKIPSLLIIAVDAVVFGSFQVTAEQYEGDSG